MIRDVALHDPIRRVAALVVAMSLHLAMLILLMRPAFHQRSDRLIGPSDRQALQLRFLRPPQPSSVRISLPSHRMIASARHIHPTQSARPSQPATAQRTTHAASPPSAETSPSSADTPIPATDHRDTLSDGGFQDRLLKAQASHAVHGVPGSADASFVAGIHLADPRTQGVAAVMRQAQRLFGVTNRHCIDVDVWRHLTPQELSARHISREDMQRVDEEYHCNQPLGLSF
jgi:hypothetical protein